MIVDTNKTELEILDKIFQDFENGDIDGVDAFLIAKKLDSISKAIKQNSDIESDVINECGKYAKGEIFSKGGYKVEYRNRTTYDYSNTPTYVLLKKSFDDKLKSMQEIAKNALRSSQGVVFVPDENGEMIEINAAIPKYSGSVVLTKIK